MLLYFVDAIVKYRPKAANVEKPIANQILSVSLICMDGSAIIKIINVVTNANTDNITAIKFFRFVASISIPRA